MHKDSFTGSSLASALSKRHGSLFVALLHRACACDPFCNLACARHPGSSSHQSALLLPFRQTRIPGMSDALPVTHFRGSVINCAEPRLRRERASKKDQPSVPRREGLEAHLLYRSCCHRTASAQGHLKANQLLKKAFGLVVVRRLSTWRVAAPQRPRNNTKMGATLPAMASGQHRPRCPCTVRNRSGMVPLSYCCMNELV